MADNFQGYTSGLDAPASGGAAVTPNDSTDLTTTSRAIIVGGAGNIAVTFVDGSDVTIVGLLAGQVYPFRVSRIKSTGTTATDIVAIW